MVQFSRNIDVKLNDGQTERFVVQTFNDDAVRVDLSANGSPYDVDIQTASEYPSGEAEFDTADYEQCLPLGTETYTDTSEHSTASEVVGESVFISITNNSGGSLTFTGQVSTHSNGASSSVQQFVTGGTGSRASAFRDGRSISNSKSVKTDNVLNNPSEDVAASLYSAMAQGFPALLSVDGGIKLVDPRDFDSDNAALDALVSYALRKEKGSHALHIPPMMPDGNPLIIKDTVTIGDDSKTAQIINLYQHPVKGHQGGWINTTITDGSPLFDIKYDGGTSGGEFKGLQFNLGGADAIPVRIEGISNWSLEKFRFSNVNNSALQISSRCYAWSVDDCFFRMNKIGSKGIELVDLEGNGNAPGQGYIRAGNEWDFDHSIGVDITVGSSNIFVSGHIEGSNTGHIRAKDANATVYVTPQTSLTQGSGTGVLLDDVKNAVIAAGRISGMSEGIAVESTTGSNVNRFHISPYIDFQRLTNDNIRIDSKPNDTSIVPYESQVRGTVTYPSGPWIGSLKYPDGWALDNEDVVTVPAGGSVTGNAVFRGDELFCAFSFATEPASDAVVRKSWIQDTSASGARPRFTEELANNDIDITYRTYQR